MKERKPDANKEDLEKANYILGLDKIKENKIIFVYCPPRVGSTSLVSTLRLSGSHIFKVLHIHDEEMLRVVGKIENVTVMDIIKYNESLGREIFVFDIYRDPLERKMSEFFGKIASYHFNAEISEIENYPIERLSKRFNNIFPFIGEEDHFLEKYTECFENIPPNFDFTNKILHVQNENIHFLKLRLRDFDSWHKILAPILKINITKIVDNKRDMLKLNDLYKMFKDNYKIPKNLYNSIIGHKSFHYYLSPEESNAYIKKLKTTLCEPFEPFKEDEYKAYTFISSENQKNIDIEKDHYFDEGCQCDYCQQTRALTIMRIEKGLPPTHKILHRLCYKKIKLEPKFTIQPYKSEISTFQDEKDNSEQKKTEAKSKLKIETEKLQVVDLIKQAKILHDKQIEKEKTIELERERLQKEHDEQAKISIQQIKKQKEEREKERIKNLKIIEEIKKEEKINLKLEIEKQEKEARDKELEKQQEDDEINYLTKINNLKIATQKKVTAQLQNSIAAEKEEKQKRLEEIETMNFKEKAISIKKKLMSDIFGADNLEAEIAYENEIKRDTELISDFTKKKSLTQSSSSINMVMPDNISENKQTSIVVDHINQPPPIPRESAMNYKSLNHSNSSLDTISQPVPPPRRIYKRSDGSFVYFVREKNSNTIKMVPFEDNNYFPSTTAHFQ